MLIHKETNSLVFNAQDPLMVREILSNSRIIDHPQYNIAVQHTLGSAKVLRNMGFAAPAPIRTDYHWPGKFTPFDHQVVMAEFLTIHRRAFNLSEMGAAKTNAALWAADWLMTTGRVRKCMVISPLSTLERVWANDIFDTLMHRRCTIVHGSREKRLKALEADVDFYIMNHDAVTIDPVMDAIARRPDIDLFIVDEAGMFRNHSTRKYKALNKLVKRQDIRLWLLTGTPCPNAPTDAWALARLVDPNKVPRYFGAFRRETMAQVSQFKWVPRPDAFDIAYKAMQPAVRFKKSECLDLPPVTYQDRLCQMSKEQNKAFKELRTMGWISGDLPRMIAVQASGCAPMVKAYEAGERHAER